MNNVSLNNQEIELVFNNCECINIDMCAIENLQFEVESEQFIWDKHKIKADMEKIHGKDTWEGDNPGGCFG